MINIYGIDGKKKTQLAGVQLLAPRAVFLPRIAGQLLRLIKKLK
jgi:hypothetical protein